MFSNGASLAAEPTEAQPAEDPHGASSPGFYERLLGIAADTIGAKRKKVTKRNKRALQRAKDLDVLFHMDLLDRNSARRRKRTAEEGAQMPECAVTLMKPATLINNSGGAVKRMVERGRFYARSELLVVYDDFTIPFGTCVIKAKGSSAGHNGMVDISKRLKTTNFARLRIGVGAHATGVNEHATNNISSAKFVLQGFSAAESAKLEDLNEWIWQVLRVYLHRGTDEAMHLCNQHNLQTYMEMRAGILRKHARDVEQETKEDAAQSIPPANE